MKKLFLFIGIIFFSLIFVSAIPVLLSDQGTDLRVISSGDLVDNANLTIYLYDSSTGGSLIYSKTFVSNITNGSWNVMINPDLEFGKFYWKDYEINSDNLNFSGEDRLQFQSPLGLINDASLFNFSLIDSCANGSSMRQINENGSVICEIDDSGTGGDQLSISGSKYLYNNSGVLNINESVLNVTIDSRATGLGDNSSWNETYANTKYIIQSEEGNLNVNFSNSTIWWASVSSWLSGWFTNNAGVLEFNETKLNNTIDARSGGDTQKNVTGPYLYNDTTTIYFNETKLNATIDLRENDTKYFVSTGLELNGSNYFGILLGYSMPQNCNDGEVAEYNTSSGGWDCAIDNYSGGEWVLASSDTAGNESITDGELVTFADDNKYLNSTRSNNTITYFVNEIKLNNTIDARDTDTNETTRFDNLVGNCTFGNFVSGVNSGGNKVCTTSSGSGDITNVQGDGNYIYNGSTSGEVFLGFNETYLNNTISNEGLSLGFNSTFNLTYDSKANYQFVGNDFYGGGNFTTTGNVTASYFVGDGSQLTGITGDNSSWNESYADTKYLQSYTETDPFWSANYSLYNTSWNTDTTYIAGSNLTLTETEFSANMTSLENYFDTIYQTISGAFDSLFSSLDFTGTTGFSDLVDNDTTYSVLSEFIDDLGHRGYINNLNFTNGAGYYNSTDFNINDYYLKSNPFVFWNDTYATFNKTYADTLYADISVTGDNSSWNESYADTLYYGNGDDTNFSSVNTTIFTIKKAGFEDFSMKHDVSGYPGFFGTYGDFFFGINSDRTTYFNYYFGENIWLGQNANQQNVRIYGNLTTDKLVSTGNITTEGIHLEKDPINHRIYDNSTCVIIEGDTSTMYIC